MKVLILYASFGSGHKRAAEAVLEAFQDRDIPVQCRDLLDFLPPVMSAFYSWAYHYMITSSRRLWRLTYNAVNAPKRPYRPATAITQSWQFSRLKEFILQGNYTHVLSTHFTPSALISDWCAANVLRCETFSIITDHEAHRCWKRTGLNHYFVPSAKVASEMRAIGVPEKDITVSGIPVSSVFSSGLTQSEARQQFESRPGCMFRCDHSKKHGDAERTRICIW
jgi:processive 1,2-diacylglycerol beta-glucosyltransferase